MNIQKMMKQAQQMQQKIQQLQTDAETREFEGSSGGGLVKATLNGKGTALKLSVDASLLDPQEKDMMEDLIIAAFNDAKASSEASMEQEMANITGGMGLPAGMKLPF